MPNRQIELIDPVEENRALHETESPEGANRIFNFPCSSRSWHATA